MRNYGKKIFGNLRQIIHMEYSSKSSLTKKVPQPTRKLVLKKKQNAILEIKSS